MASMLFQILESQFQIHKKYKLLTKQNDKLSKNKRSLPLLGNLKLQSQLVSIYSLQQKRFSIKILQKLLTKQNTKIFKSNSSPILSGHFKPQSQLVSIYSLRQNRISTKIMEATIKTKYKNLKVKEVLLYQVISNPGLNQLASILLNKNDYL